jgi:hypothetical protein
MQREEKIQNRELEKLYLEHFKKDFPQFPPGVISQHEPPAADFIITQGNKKFGLELTRLYKDEKNDSSSIQAQATLKDRLVQKAWYEYNKKSNRKYKVVISFVERSNIDKNDLENLAKFLVEKIVDKLKTNTPSYWVTIGGCDLAPHTDIFQLVQIGDFADSWSQINSYRVEPFSQANLIKAIDKKEAKEYAKCDEMWLVLLANFFNPLMLEIPEDLKIEIREGQFDRIFLYRYPGLVFNLFNKGKTQ